MAGRFVIKKDGTTRLIPPTQADLDARAAELPDRIERRKERHTDAVKRKAKNLRTQIVPDTGEAARILSAMANKRSKGEVPTQADLAREQAALNKVTQLDVISAKESELLQAIVDGKKVDPRVGSIDGVGTW